MRWCTYCQRASEVVVVVGGFYFLEEAGGYQKGREEI